MVPEHCESSPVVPSEPTQVTVRVMTPDEPQVAEQVDQPPEDQE
jgi:hypothetical protein